MAERSSASFFEFCMSHFVLAIGLISLETFISELGSANRETYGCLSFQ